MQQNIIKTENKQHRFPCKLCENIDECEGLYSLAFLLSSNNFDL